MFVCFFIPPSPPNDVDATPKLMSFANQMRPKTSRSLSAVCDCVMHLITAQELWTPFLQSCKKKEKKKEKEKKKKKKKKERKKKEGRFYAVLLSNREVTLQSREIVQQNVIARSEYLLVTLLSSGVIL